MLDRPKPAQILQILDVDMPIINLVAALAHEIADHVLTRTFGAPRTRDRHEIPGGGELRIEAGINGI
jgi:hypothetical protein